jgi:16S rRNA C1402 N4-methylase RsmH
MALGSQVGSLNGNQRGSMASRALNQRIKRAAKATAKAKVNPARQVFQALNARLLAENAAVRRERKRVPVRRHNRPYLSTEIASS